MGRGPLGPSRENLEGGGWPSAENLYDMTTSDVFEKDRCTKKIFGHVLQKVFDYLLKSKNPVCKHTSHVQHSYSSSHAIHTIGMTEARNLCGYGLPPPPRRAERSLYRETTSDVFEKDRCTEKIFGHGLEKVLDNVCKIKTLYVNIHPMYNIPIVHSHSTHTIGMVKARKSAGARLKAERNGPPGPAGNPV